MTPWVKNESYLMSGNGRFKKTSTETNNFSSCSKVVKNMENLHECGRRNSTLCFRYILPPKKLQKVLRRCIPAVSKCPSDWTDQEIAQACDKYTARVKDASKSNSRAEKYGHIYRNAHCAVCNGVSYKNMKCGTLLNVPDTESVSPGSVSLPTFTGQLGNS